jgi:hypothetical protein
LRIGVDPLQLPALVLDDYQRAPHALSWVYYAPRIGHSDGSGGDGGNGDSDGESGSVDGSGNGTDGSGCDASSSAPKDGSSTSSASASSASASSASAASASSSAASAQCALARTPSWHADRLHRPDLLRHFLTRALIGAERPFAKSAPTPRDQIGPMMEVVGDTFQVLICMWSIACVQCTVTLCSRCTFPRICHHI